MNTISQIHIKQKPILKKVLMRCLKILICPTVNIVFQILPTIYTSRCLADTF